MSFYDDLYSDMYNVNAWLMFEYDMTGSEARDIWNKMLDVLLRYEHD